MTPLAPLACCWFLGALLLLLDGRRRWVALLAVVGLTTVLALDVWLVVGFAGELARSLDADGAGRLGGKLVGEDGAAAHAAFEVVTGGWAQGVGIRLRVDALALFFAAFSSFVLWVVMAGEARSGVRSRRFPALVVLLLAGLHGAFFTGDLFNFYVFFEVAIVASFALAAYGEGRTETRGAFIYVVLNLLGSSLFLFGVAGLYHSGGTLDLQQLGQLVHRDAEAGRVLPATLIFTSLALKLGIYPFHGWVPVLYGHVRPAVAAALGGALVNIGAYGLIRIGMGSLFVARELSELVLMGLGAVAILYGSLLAAHGRRPAEIAAYASVVHAGQLVLALGIGGVQGIAAMLLLAGSGSLDKAGLFLARDALGTPRRIVSRLAGCSVAGLPLTFGFIAKIQLFRAAIGPSFGWLLMGALAVSSILTLVAVARYWSLLDAAEQVEPEVRGPCRSARPGLALSFAASSKRGAPVLTLSLAIAALGLVPGPVTRLATAIAAQLTGGRG